MSLFASYHHGESLLDTTYLISIIAVTLTLALAGSRQGYGTFLEIQAVALPAPFRRVRVHALACRLQEFEESRAPRS